MSTTGSDSQSILNGIHYLSAITRNAPTRPNNLNRLMNGFTDSRIVVQHFVAMRTLLQEFHTEVCSDRPLLLGALVGVRTAKWQERCKQREACFTYDETGHVSHNCARNERRDGNRAS